MGRRITKEPPLDQPAACILFPWGGYSVWVKPEQAEAFIARLRKRNKGERYCLVRRKPRKAD